MPTNPPSRIPLAWRNLTENRLRLLASLAGTAFAVTLMFMEHGFQQSLLESMVGLIRHLDGELMIVSRTVYTLSVPYGFPYRRIEQARAFPEVRAARAGARSRRGGRSGGAPPTACRGRSASSPIRRTTMRSTSRRSRPRRDEWRPPGTAMADRRSRTQRLGPLEAGVVSELSGKTVSILGTFELGADYQSDGTLVMSDSTLADIFPDRRGPSRGDDDVTVGVLRVRPGADLERLRRAIAGGAAARRPRAHQGRA